MCVTTEMMLKLPTVRFSSILTKCGLALALVATGCSSFNSDWKRASASSPPAHEIDGPWEGSWLSDRNGHHGRLRCLVSRLEERTYSARFKATYWKIFGFSYTVNLQGTQEPARPLNFQGKADLGWWGGGVYHYDGQATPTNLFSTYKSKYDHGTFRMARPEMTAH
jgi:hypothetical protein